MCKGSECVSADEQTRKTRWQEPALTLANPASVVVISTQRSGSTYFCERLHQSGLCGNPVEWFQTSKQQELLRAYGLPPDVDFLEFWEQVLSRETDAHGVFGIKVMADSWFDCIDPWLVVNPCFGGTTMLQRLAAMFPHPRVVLVTRRDRLRQAISWIKAERTGLWEYPGAPVPYPRGAVPFDYLAIDERMRRIERQDAAWRELLRDAPFRTCEVVFEEFCADWQAGVRRVLDALDLAAARGAIAPLPEPEHKLVRMSDDLNEQWLQRFREVRARMATAGAGIAAGVPEPLRADLHASPGPCPAFHVFSNMTVDAHACVAGEALTVECGARFVVPVVVRNTSSATWSDVGREDGSGWITLRGMWRAAAGEAVRDGGRGYLPATLAPGAEAVVVLALTAPAEVGAGTLVLTLERDGPPPGFSVLPTQTLAVTVCPHRYREAARAWFGALTPLDQGWVRSDWYGEFMDYAFPWIYHAEHGWQFCENKTDGDDTCVLYDRALDHISTRPHEYPLVCQIRGLRLLRYERGTRAPRRFLDPETGAVLEFPANGEP